MKVLSTDQIGALDALTASIDRGRLETVLTGPAGTGKTTLMQEVVNHYAGRRDIRLLCPTGKAAKVLASKVGIEATTIHRAIYGSVHDSGGKLNFGKLKEPCDRGGLVVCDEASMVGQRLHQDLMRMVRQARAQVLFLGDKEQLSPVNDEWGPDLDNPTAELTKVHRQALESTVLRAATWVREGHDPRQFDGWGAPDCLALTDDPAEWLVAKLSGSPADSDAILLCFSNKQRVEINNRVRALLGRQYRLEPGDLVVCGANNADTGMMNGETARVLEVYGDPQQTDKFGVQMGHIKLDNGVEGRVATDLIGAGVRDYSLVKARIKKKFKDPCDDLLLLDYGYCLTVHKSQGSQYDHVGFVDDGALRWLRGKNPEEWRRLTYTGYTRAAKTLTALVIGRMRRGHR